MQHFLSNRLRYLPCAQPQQQCRFVQTLEKQKFGESHALHTYIHVHATHTYVYPYACPHARAQIYIYVYMNIGGVSNERSACLRVK